MSAIAVIQNAKVLERRQSNDTIRHISFSVSEVYPLKTLTGIYTNTVALRLIYWDIKWTTLCVSSICDLMFANSMS